MLKVGEKLPAGSLMEFVEVEGNGCSIGPNSFDVAQSTAGKTIAIFALPGAYTPTCSAKHVPGFVEHADAFKAAGVDEIWCVSVNDAFVMGAWGRDQHTAGKVRMMADGSAAFTAAAGLTLDLTARGMGVRSQRYSMLVVDGVVKALNIEAPAKFEVSDAGTLLAQALFALSRNGALGLLLNDVPEWPGRGDEGWILGAGQDALLRRAGP
jgi:peroxiredoxin